jgi:hypothetical protein
MVTDYQLYDIVEMKKPHPCDKRSKKFQIIRVGADIKIKCLGCGRVIMLDRADFNERIQKVISHETGPLN